MRADYGDAKLGDVQVKHALGGMRGLPALLWEGSELDPAAGIRFRGLSIAECQQQLPGPPPPSPPPPPPTPSSEEGQQAQQQQQQQQPPLPREHAMLPEAMFWLLLTGRVPTTAQVRGLSRALAAPETRAPAQRQAATPLLPGHIFSLLHHLPRDTHPMTMLATGVAALGRRSAFARAYARGTAAKHSFWQATFDDCLALLACLPALAAAVYWRTQRSGARIELPMAPTAAASAPDPERDWTHNFAAMLGRDSVGHDEQGEKDASFRDFLRLYLALHADHEGGNVSAHATHLVGSALSDPYLSYSAGLMGLAGPLHGYEAFHPTPVSFFFCFFYSSYPFFLLAFPSIPRCFFFFQR